MGYVNVQLVQKTAFSIKGVKTASWDIQAINSFAFDANKVSLESVRSHCKAGHDTPLATAPDEVHENLPLCCLYDRKKKEE